jgi:hypothetical protein
MGPKLKYRPIVPIRARRWSTKCRPDDKFAYAHRREKTPLTTKRARLAQRQTIVFAEVRGRLVIRCEPRHRVRISAPGQPPVRRNGSLEVVVFLAGNEAEVFQRRQKLLCPGRLPKHQISFAEMLMRAAVAGI